MSHVVVNVYHRREIEDTPTCTFPVTDSTSLDELRRHIYAGCRLLPSQVDLTINARLNTAPPGSAEKYRLFGIDHEMIWHMVLQNATPVLNFSLLDLVVESVPVNNQTNYDPCPASVPGSSKEIPVPDSPIGCDDAPVVESPRGINSMTPQNLYDLFDRINENTSSDSSSDDLGDDPVVGEDDMAEIEDEIRVQEILKEWQMSIPFINRGLQHPCPAFNDDVPMPYKDEAFFGNPPRLDGPFSVGQMFESKAELKSKLFGFAMKKNFELQVTQTNKTCYVVICRAPRCPWRLYAKTTETGSWIIVTNPYEHSCYSIAAKVDSRQMTARMIAEIIKPGLIDDLEFTIKACRNAVRIKFPTVQPSYNKIWRGREKAIGDLFGSWEKAYELLPSLLNAIQRSNPGTKYRIQHEPSPCMGVHIFNRVAWAFGPCIKA